ncbi:MAG TPA: recombinase family protein [Acetobacteraceae bacterium]|nr:recombinase family protein [Acetobacteraceae bacterium]
MGRKWGYARVSTDDQATALQVDALKAAGVPEGNIVEERISGAAKVRPAFHKLLGRLEPGDELVVWKVDRLGRNTLDALQTAERLRESGIGLVITTLGVDITKEAGRLVFGLMAQIAEFERGLIRERVNAGLRAAKARGQALGRKPRLTPHQRKEAARMAAEGKSYAQIAATLGVARSIAFRAVQAVNATQAAQAEAA